MYFSDIITLRRVESVENNGYMKPSLTSSSNVWANLKSLNRAEFYAAMANGQKYDIAFEVHSEDYADQNQILYGGEIYEIVRTYAKGLGIVELVCQKRGKL